MFTVSCWSVKQIDAVAVLVGVIQRVDSRVVGEWKDFVGDRYSALEPGFRLSSCVPRQLFG